MAWVFYANINNGWSSPMLFDYTKYRYRIRNTAQAATKVTFLIDSYHYPYTVQSGDILSLSSTIAPNNCLIAHDFNGSIIPLEREALNTAPTTPGAFTQPTGTLETGDSKVISWGVSTDAEGNLSKYVLEASINGGTYAVIAQPTSPTFTYTVPTATSVKFRVKAVDAGGLESAYRESVLFTVTKPMYYWSKYNATAIAGTRLDNAPWVHDSVINNGLTGFYKAYFFDSAANTYSQWGEQWAFSETYVGAVGYQVFGSKLNRLTLLNSSQLSKDTKDPANNAITPTTYTRGSLVQSNIAAVEGSYPTDGRHSDGFWYVRGSRVSQSIAPPGGFTTPAQNALLLPKQALTLAYGASTAPNISTYEVEHRHNGGAWAIVGTHSNALTRPFTVTSDKLLTTVEFRVRAKNTSNVYSDYVYSEAFQIEHNRIPTLTLETDNNKTLYETDTFVINGSALDTDVGDIVNVYYRLNGGTSRAIATGISTGASIPFNEQLTFKGGKFYKDDAAITDALAEGPAHRLEVWSEDNQGGKSAIAERTFYVVPNRAPSLTIDTFSNQSGLINVDTLAFSGIANDPDGNDVTVKYRVNSGLNTQIHNGPAGAWSFNLLLSTLSDGENSIIVEVTDTYGFKSSKTLKLNKHANLTPLTTSTQRYKIVAPSGSAKGVLLWIQRDTTLTVSADISMTTGVEQETYLPMTLDGTAPVNADTVEDEFFFEAAVAKDNINVRLTLTGAGAITLISGVLS